MAKSVKHIRITVPKDIHSKLKGQAAFCGNTLAEWIVKILKTAAYK
jgi:hypothetical protein